MRRQIARAAGTAAVAAGLLAGCQSNTPRPYDDNPLLMSRQPLVIPPPQPIATTSARRNPNGPMPMPSVPPATTVVKEPAPERREVADAGPLLPAAASGPAAALEPPAAPVAALHSPMPAVPVAETTTPPVMPVPADLPTVPAPALVPSTVRQVAGKYGHGPDYAWLQGELDRNYRGSVDLRYRPASEDDAWGGKVRLADDPRLADFRPGDVVAVEGEIVRDAGDGAWEQYPRFHVREIKLVERAAQK